MSGEIQRRALPVYQGNKNNSFPRTGIEPTTIAYTHIQYVYLFIETNLAISVPYARIELLALQYEEVVRGLQYAALDGDGARRVHVVAGHHPHCDTCLLTFPYCFWYLRWEIIRLYVIYYMNRTGYF